MNDSKPPLGKLTDLTFDKQTGSSIAISFKIITSQGANASLGAGAQLLPWDKLKVIGAATGEHIAFEHTQLYAIVDDQNGKIMMRTAPASKAPGDIKIETVYVPKPAGAPVSREAETASFRRLSTMLKDLGIIDMADSVQFTDAIRRELEGPVAVPERSATKKN